MMLITGATGTVGRHVVELLRARGEGVRALTRDPARMPAADGMEVVRGDFDDAESLRRAADGVTAVFLLTAPPEPHAGHDLAMIAAARAAGVPRMVKLSAIGTGVRYAGSVIGSWHLEGEEALRSSGLNWTVLRPSVFASNTLWWADAIRTGTPVPDTADGAAQGIVDPRDVAACAAAVLTWPGHDSATYTLTGPQALSVPEQAAILSQILGRDIEVRSAPAPVAAWAAGVSWARDGHNATVTDDVPRLLDRPARPFATWAEDHRAAFN
jgi:uncharacterized protein YbjT (DUF2867 family)